MSEVRYPIAAALRDMAENLWSVEHRINVDEDAEILIAAAVMIDLYEKRLAQFERALRDIAHLSVPPKRRGVEDMRANIPYGLSADDFKDMLDEHEATCVAAHAQEYRAPVAPPDITGRSAMQRLLDAAGWDAGSLRHRQLLDALAGSQLEIVPNFRLSCGHELIDPSKPCEVCATADQPHARP
jgi:hypothetical protein